MGESSSGISEGGGGEAAASSAGGGGDEEVSSGLTGGGEGGRSSLIAGGGGGRLPRGESGVAKSSSSAEVTEACWSPLVGGFAACPERSRRKDLKRKEGDLVDASD